MTFLLTTKPNWLLPVFRQTGLVLEYKRFPADYMWRPFLDLSELSFDTTDIDDAIAALEMSVTDLYDLMDLANADILALYTGLSDANIAIVAAQNDATNALSDAAAAQATADAALAAAGGAAAFPNGHTLSPRALKTLSGGFAQPSFSTSVWLSQFCLMSGLNTEAEITLPFAAGNWVVEMLVTKGATSGDTTLYFDNVDKGFSSGYAASNTNAILTWVVNSVTAGLHTARFKITGHQPSSSGYTLAASQIIMRINS